MNSRREAALNQTACRLARGNLLWAAGGGARIRVGTSSRECPLLFDVVVQPIEGGVSVEGESTWRAHDASSVIPSVAPNAFGRLCR
eukprot:5139287-Prymnesium_polylepis.1